VSGLAAGSRGSGIDAIAKNQITLTGAMKNAVTN
jgi:hypothetical protein